jgi:phospholipid/cholesterol/gamma-HCH transport system ATP-binding protein
MTLTALQPKIRVRDLTLSYAANVIQQGVSFDVKEGSIFAVMGASGSGKSTILRAMTGLKRPTAGSVCYGDLDYWTLSEARREQIDRRFGVLFQGGALWSSMSAAANVALPLQMFTTLAVSSIDALVRVKLSLVGLQSGRDDMPSSLSGGMRQRVGLARAMALDPQILFLDEPSAGLDPTSARRFDDLILDLRDGFGVTIVMVSHELPSLFDICDDGVFLDAASKTTIAHGAPRALRDHSSDPAVRAFMTRAIPVLPTLAPTGDANGTP